MKSTENSEIFQRATGRKAPPLPHPTSNQFDPLLWRKALADTKAPNEGDTHLAISAIWFGLQIRLLRSRFAELFDQTSRPFAVQMMVAQANKEYRILRERAFRKLRRKARSAGPINLEYESQLLISISSTGQRQTADGVIEGIVDTLPHWFFHARQLPPQGGNVPNSQIYQRAAATMLNMSLERALRQLWQHALWQDWRLGRADNGLVFAPEDVKREQLWMAWELRQQSLGLQGSFLDRVALHGSSAPPPNIEPIIHLSVTGFETRPGQKRVPKVGKLPRWGDRQRTHATRWARLRDSYLEPKLEEPLPSLAPHPITPKMLFGTWCVISDLVDVMLRQLTRPALLSREAQKRHALPIDHDQLVTLLTKSLDLAHEVAASAIGFLTADYAAMTEIFHRGFWSTPLVPAPAGRTLYLIAPILLDANPVRCAEIWLERGGATEGLESKGRHFERQVRQQLSEAIQDNEVLVNAGCPTTGLPDASAGEEIDALVFVGKTVLVIEAKCFISPSEPVDRYTFRQKLCDACAQAKRKATWLAAHRPILEGIFGWSSSVAEKAILLPVVVTNQSFGLGYTSNHVPVVDLHYLGLICAGPTYLADTAVQPRRGATAMAHTRLYGSQADLESRFESLLLEPIPLKRFDGRISWRTEPLPTAGGTGFNVAMPVLSAPAAAGMDVDFLASLVDIEQML